MRKFLSITMLGLGIFAFAQNTIVQFNQLPSNGQKFINKHFGAKSVSTIILDDDIWDKDYEVILHDGTKIDLDGKGNWKEVDSKRNTLPTTIIPNSIANYVRKSFPNTAVKQIEKKRFGYEIELTNGLDIEFNSKGQFKRISD